VEEVTLSCEVESHSTLCRQRNDLVIADRPTWLNNRANTGIEENL
jgi:hypothetical protein